jgi:hypothetical protein
MGLTCTCDGDYYEPGAKVWYAPRDYKPLETKRSRKCCSCGDRIAVGATSCEVPRVKVPGTDIECRIYGEEGEVPRASAYLCERCADLYFSLEELGYCVPPYEDQRELVRDYADMHREMNGA